MIEPTTLAQQGLRKATADVSTYSIFSARAADDDKDSLDGLDRHYDDEYDQPHHRASEDTESTLFGGTDDVMARRRGGGGGGGAGGASEGLLGGGGGGAGGLFGWRRNTPLGPLWLWMLHGATLTVSVLLFAISATVEPATRAYVEKFNAWSPALSAVEYQDTVFNNTKGNVTPYVGAGPEVDKAWDHITFHMGDQMISPWELKHGLGKPPNRLQVTDSHTGQTGYRVELAVVHQLHCLNMIRKYVHLEQYHNDTDIAAGKEKLQHHMTHCIEALRLKLMCEADVGVLPFYEKTGADGKTEPDYESKHVCKNFDKVREWAVHHKVADKTTF
ncbi:hypothetical protein IWX90DRAFT_161044 [Phyllosticta citrichinensis]|uniref:Uncharacterized protein n=1 Tax=Phyllosticta citrichinensis TaxID=1130410 RepID=A0ABR1Y0Y2_9PEZI